MNYLTKITLLALLVNLIIVPSSYAQIKEQYSPEQTLNQLAAELKDGDIEAVLLHFSPSPRHRRLFESLSAEMLDAMSTAFTNAENKSLEQDRMAVYTIPWKGDNGEPITKEIMLSKSDEGKWYIISW